jgi:hypothetical protein
MTATQSAAQAADQAAEAIRALNYATLPHEGAPGLEYPGDAYMVIASLKTAVERMPQLFAQLTGWLTEQEAAGKVGHDSGGEAREYVAQVGYWLGAATGEATQLAAALGKAHNTSAGLKAAD